MTCRKVVAVLLVLVCESFSSAQDLPQAGDIVLGLGAGDPNLTLELVRGPAGTMTGMMLTDPWTDTGFIQGVQFDNLGGVGHNPQGNLLGIDFGTTTIGGSIYNFATTTAVGAGQKLSGDGTAITTGRLGGLAVSPDNTQVAVNDYDAGAILVFDYAAGDTMGGGAALSGMMSSDPIVTVRDTQGTAWLDNETVVTLNSNGSLYSIDVSTMMATEELFLLTPFVGSDSTAVEYNPEVSPYVYAAYSGFDSVAMETNNKLYVINPSDFSLIHTVDLSTSANTLRDLALDRDGNLYMSQYGGDNADPGPYIDLLMDVVSSPATIADNSSVDYYRSTVDSAFNGIDIAHGTTPDISCDFNNDEMCDEMDADGLVEEIVQVAGGSMPDLSFDLNGDLTVNDDDLTVWLAEAGTENGFANPILRGDANVDGTVDGADFLAWNTDKFTDDKFWSGGDFNADGTTDGADFLTWNTNKFQSSDVSAVPEPAAGVISLLALAFVIAQRK